MSLTRAYEEHEIAPDLRRVYSSVRNSFDLPFVPSLFKLLSAVPEYLKSTWSLLEPVASSKEFRTAAGALQELAHSKAVSGGWTFSDQPKVLAADKFPNTDIRVFGGTIGLFARATAQMAIFSRIIQRGYSGGQRGRVTSSKQISALSQMVTIHIPNEREAGLRVWLIYSDIKKTTGAKVVPDVFRVLAPFPAYLSSAWIDSRRVLADLAFVRAQEELNRRTRALLTGIPVRDHRSVLEKLSPEQRYDVEETVDGCARLLPQLVLLTAVWQRSFPSALRLIGAA
jgi:hypothetical protein